MNPKAGAVGSTAIIVEYVIKMYLAILASFQVLANLWAAWHIG